MNIIVYRDGEQSLHAMRRAYLASTVLTYARNTEKSHTLVGHDFLNARYYDSSRGQFLSEDPVFWEVGQTQDGKAALSNPQALNSYAYANGNPITNKDPNGKFGAAAALPFVYATGDVGLAATAEIWGPPLLIGAGVAAVAIGGYSLYKSVYPGPGIDYQTTQLATENAYKTDPTPNGNWKGTTGAIIGSGILLKWMSDNANGGTDGPTNFDWIYAIYQKLRGEAPETSGSNSTSESAKGDKQSSQSTQSSTRASPYIEKSRSSMPSNNTIIKTNGSTGANSKSVSTRVEPNVSSR
jgi:RHS repeat-associated protein